MGLHDTFIHVDNWIMEFYKSQDVELINHKRKKYGYEEKKRNFLWKPFRGVVATGKKVSPVFDAITGGKVQQDIFIEAIGGSKELKYCIRERNACKRVRARCHRDARNY